MKSEPDAYSIDDLERDGREMWDGIRNYQARNMMRDDMRVGDEVFFYHSSCKQPGIVGICRVAIIYKRVIIYTEIFEYLVFVNS